MICSCDDPDEIYLRPRRTKELLQSPLHRDMLAKESKTMLTTPRLMHSGAKVCEKDSENIYFEPRRIKELLRSPWNREENVVSPRLDRGVKIMNSDPRRAKIPREASLKPPFAKKLFKSPQKNMPMMTENSEDLFKSPLPSNQNTPSKPVDEKCLYSEPRRIKELLKSPLHKDMRSYFRFPDREASQNVQSEPRRTTDLLYSKSMEKDRLVKRKLQFSDKQNLDKILKRLEKYLQGTTDFKDISKQNLHQLSVQDFINIVEHLLSLTGIPMKLLDKSNYIERTIIGLKQLKYPHIVRKSWLLMPSASLPHVAQLLDFLLDFAPHKIQEFEFDFKTQFDREKFVVSAEIWREVKG